MAVKRQPINALRKVAGNAWGATAIGLLRHNLPLSAVLALHGNLATVQWPSACPGWYS